MGRETKIGLLVGMSFIVCFAIILSHRGLVRVDDEGGLREADTVVARSFSTTGLPPAWPAPAAGARTGAAQQKTNAGLARHADAVKTPGQVTDRGQVFDGPIDLSSGRVQPSGSRPSEPPVNDPTRSVEPTRPEQASPVPSTPVRVGRQASRDADTTPVGPSDGALPPAILGEYLVQPGDSLSRIARRHYGSATPSIVRAIVAANRDKLPSADQVRAGLTIVLPKVASAGSSVTASGEVSPRTERSQASGGSGFADYVIQPGDTVSRIAKLHYGTATPSIIEAIAQANRDLLPNVDRIAAGQSIRLPDLDDARLRRPSRVTQATPTRPAARIADGRQADRGGSRVVDGANPVRGGKGWRWYTVKKGDVLSRVAAAQLGSAKRWPELADLNKDIFPDAGRIRDGVRIRIPSPSAAAHTTAANGGNAG